MAGLTIGGGVRITSAWPSPVLQRLFLAAIAVTIIVVVGWTLRPAPAAAPTQVLPPEPIGLVAIADGPVGSGNFHGVLVQRTTHFTTGNSNDSIPDFDRQLYDTDGAWDLAEPDRIVIPDAWDGQPVIFTVRGAWAGHTDTYVELKLYCGAERPIGIDQEADLVAVVQSAPNPASPFVELTTPPLEVDAGAECMIAFRTPAERTLIAYGQATTLFGAYLVGD